jgi:hypothetical protein
VESLVISDTATASPAGAAAEEAGAAAEEAGAAAEEAGAAAEAAADELSLEDELPPQAARVTESAPITAMPATARPRVKRLVMWFPFEG